MITGSSTKRRGEWENASDTITLDEQARHRRRMAMVSDEGIAFLLDLPEATLLRQGDAIVLDDGRLVEVVAKPEDLYAVTGRDRRHLLALAWQIGNRHLPAQMSDETILIRRDAVIQTMLEGLGATVTQTTGAFDPEGGAYEAGGAHHHVHDHHHAHDHYHAHEHP